MSEIIVVKVGTRSLLGDHEAPEATVFQQIADDIDALYDDYQIALVASGAVGFGVQHMGLAARPEYAPEQQALSMIGQVGLLRRWRESLEPRPIGQVLVTRHDLKEEETNEAFVASVHALWQYGAVPVINENDAVSSEGISFGDNDRLAAAVARSLGATKLVLLTNQNGIMEQFGTDEQRRLPQADLETLREHVQPAISDMGTGGATSKLLAAESLRADGVEVYISDARIDRPIQATLSGEMGTKIVQ